MMPNATALATLTFAAMADISSVVRCYQNQRYWGWVQRNHRRWGQRLRLVFIRGRKPEIHEAVRAVFSSRYRDPTTTLTGSRRHSTLINRLLRALRMPRSSLLCVAVSAHRGVEEGRTEALVEAGRCPDTALVWPRPLLYAPDRWSILPLYRSGARLLGAQQTVLTCCGGCIILCACTYLWKPSSLASTKRMTSN